MFKRFRAPALAAALGLAAFGVAGSTSQPATAQTVPQLSVLASYQADAGFDEAGAEIVAYEGDRMFVVNGSRQVIEVVDISDPTAPTFLFDISVSAWGGDVTSVAISSKGLLVAAVPAEDKTEPGQAIFFDLTGQFIAAAPTGALPDMATFTPNGAWALIANEGEPSDDYSVDPEGSVTIIKTSAVKPGRDVVPAIAIDHVTFEAFNVGGSRHAELPADVRIFGPGASVAQDLEPEYIAVTPNNRMAFVGLQENNAIAVIDVQRAQVEEIRALGFKDHSIEGNGIDPSNRDDGINIATWPVLGAYMPDAIATYRVGGTDYVVTANEGDAREWGDFIEPVRLADLVETTPLCADVFPNAAELIEEAALGRLNITTPSGLRSEGENAPCYEEIVAFGARSFTIWGPDGEVVFDSGDDFEQIVATENPEFFNATNDENNFDNRSDDKGPEPEGVVIGELNGRTYAFIGLERVGGVMVYDVTDPANSTFVQYINNRSFEGEAPTVDSGPEGLAFVSPSDSPTGAALLLVANEITATVTVFDFK